MAIQIKNANERKINKAFFNGDTCDLLDPLSDYKSCVLDKGVCESKYTKCEYYNSDVEKDTTSFVVEEFENL